MLSKSAEELIHNPKNIRPHVVILGAGASRAAFPNGDANGRSLPLMCDLIHLLELTPLLDASGISFDPKEFESTYSALASQVKYSSLIRQIEQAVENYFSSLALPDYATIYDKLVLSLRPDDSIFTFNWDPFLFDAYIRNRDTANLPMIHFLHGNVRIGICSEHGVWDARGAHCSDCSKPLVPTPLLYPVTKKDYSSNPYIKHCWELAKDMLANAFTVTIFGYGAPSSDHDAVELMRTAWLQRSNRTFEHVEIIDIADYSDLYSRWSPFTPTHHLHQTPQFSDSRISRWPRRSCESLYYPMAHAIPCGDFPIPNNDSLQELRSHIKDIARFETLSHNSDL